MLFEMMVVSEPTILILFLTTGPSWYIFDTIGSIMF